VIGGVPIYALSPPLGERRAGSATAVRDALLGSLRRESPGIVLAPAGLAQAEDDDLALQIAESLRGAARQAGMALVFGVDVGPPRPGSIRLYSCLGGSPMIWPAFGGRGCPFEEILRARILRIGCARLLVLTATEALDPSAPRKIHAAGGVDAIAILSHGGATVRWSGALSRLERSAPIVVVAHHGGAGRAYATKGLGVRWLSLKEQPAEQEVMRFRSAG
jgi:hypothetical protein